MATMVRTAAEIRGIDLEPVTMDPAEAPLPPRYAGQPPTTSIADPLVSCLEL
jgi:hypothetical protein